MSKKLLVLSSAVLLVIAFSGMTIVTSFGEELPVTATTQFVVTVPPQARINVDTEGNILSIYIITDGSGIRPSILNVYQGDFEIGITSEIQANLDKISSEIDWSQGGLVYNQGAVIFSEQSESRNFHGASISITPNSALGDEVIKEANHPGIVVRYPGTENGFTVKIESFFSW